MGFEPSAGISRKTLENSLWLEQEAIFVTVCIHAQGVNSDFVYAGCHQMIGYAQRSGNTTENSIYLEILRKAMGAT